MDKDASFDFTSKDVLSAETPIEKPSLPPERDLSTQSGRGREDYRTTRVTGGDGFGKGAPSPAKTTHPGVTT